MTDTYTYDYPGILFAVLVVNADNEYTISTVSQLPVVPTPINYDGGTVVFNTDGTLTFKGITYPATSPNVWSYPGTLDITVSGTTVTAVPQRTPPGRSQPTIISGGINPKDDIPASALPEDYGTWPDLFTVELVPNPPAVTVFSPTRVIAFDVADPNQLTAYSINLQFNSGTFNYAGLGFTMPANKTALTVQGHNGIVERVANNYSRGQAPQSVEGRLLPLFTNEMIYVNKYLKVDNTPYETKTIVAEIASQAGAIVSFTATNTKVKSFEFTGRFTQALEQLAEMSCGRLLQQNGNWMILPKHTGKGAFTVKSKDIISWQVDVQSDIMDMIASLIGYLKDAILGYEAAERLRKRIQNKLDNVLMLEVLPNDPTPNTTQPSQEAWVPMSEINFQFGYNGTQEPIQLNENILIETHPAVTSWEYWPIKESKTTKFWKREVTHEKDLMGNTTERYRGLKDLHMVSVLYPFTPPSNAGLYRATGVLTNLRCTLWSGGETMYDTMHPTTRSLSVTPQGVNATPFNQLQSYFEFKVDTFKLTNTHVSPSENRLLFGAKMQVEYLPCSTTPWKFSVNLNKDYRLIGNLGYMIPINGGTVLNKNGNAVAEFDRAARVIKLQDGTIVSEVQCDLDWPAKPPTIDPLTGIYTYYTAIKGFPYQCTAPVPTPGGTTITIVGSISRFEYVLRTQAGRLFGTINKSSGEIYQENGTYVGTYSTTNSLGRIPAVGDDVIPLWTAKIGYVYKSVMGGKTETVGMLTLPNPPSKADLADMLLYGETYDTGTINFSNAVAYPLLTRDANYANLQTTLLNNQLAGAKNDKDIANAKIICLKKELDYYAIDYSDILLACDKWKIYYDAIELRDNPPIVLYPAVAPKPKTDDVIASYEVDAVAATGSAMIKINQSKPRERVVSTTYLYDNKLPLAGNVLTVETIANTGIEADGGIIETVAFNGQTITITAKKGYGA